MWVYRLGLAKAKYYALTGEWISGEEAARIELINFSYPLEKLDRQVRTLAEKLTKIPTTQLVAMKLIVNQAYDNMGLQSTQTLGPILDGIMRNTPEGREFVRGRGVSWSARGGHPPRRPLRRLQPGAPRANSRANAAISSPACRS